MNISKTEAGNTVTFALQGRLDTETSPQLLNEINNTLEAGNKDLVFDFTELQYISSAGLRVVLTAQKKINGANMKMQVTGANEFIKEVFDMTGFSDIIDIV